MPFNLYHAMFIYTTKHVYMDARTRQLVPRSQTFIFMSVDYDDDVDDAVHADNGNSHEHTSYIAPNIKSDINDSSFEKLLNFIIVSPERGCVFVSPNQMIHTNAVYVPERNRAMP